jgi:hypothetical protein
VARLDFKADRGLYEFAYIRAALKAVKEGFVPFLEFPDLNKVYYSDKPFPLIANRLMPNSRPEYAEFLASLGLSAESDPMTILARSGGRRETDQIEFFPMPAPEAATGCYSTHCLLRAIRYMPQPMVEERIARLKPGEKLFVMWDTQNEYDPHAVAVRTNDNYLLGYLPAYLTGDIWKLNTECGTIDVFVERVNLPPAEVHHRLLVRVAACWYDGFRPFDGPDFQPLAVATAA